MTLPPGTHVVTRTPTPAHPAGAVGVIDAAPLDPTHAYRVRFNDGSVASYSRDGLVVLRQFQRESAGVTPADVPTIDADFRPFVILRCVVGSQAYGLAGPDSDTDRRGIYLPPADLHWSLAGVPEQLDEDATQETYWELQKFLVLALKANPNVLEVLYSALVEHATPIARELLDLRQAFLSKVVYQTYNGYVLSQFKKLSGDLRNTGQVKWKHVMHLARLLLSGIGVLQTGVVPVRVDEPHRARLLAIRHGQLPWDEIDRWRLALHDEFDRAFAQTTLPDRPDYPKVNAFLLRARRSAL